MLWVYFSVKNKLVFEEMLKFSSCPDSH